MKKEPKRVKEFVQSYKVERAYGKRTLNVTLPAEAKEVIGFYVRSDAKVNVGCGIALTNSDPELTLNIIDDQIKKAAEDFKRRGVLKGKFSLPSGYDELDGLTSDWKSFVNFSMLKHGRMELKTHDGKGIVAYQDIYPNQYSFNYLANRVIMGALSTSEKQAGSTLFAFTDVGAKDKHFKEVSIEGGSRQLKVVFHQSDFDKNVQTGAGLTDEELETLSFPEPYTISVYFKYTK